jgi:hypothetical protein
MTTDKKQDYAAYLRSPHWRQMRGFVMKRCGGVCEECKIAYADEVHHLTYDRIGAEHPEDLVGLCRACHARTHGHRVPETNPDIPSFQSVGAAFAGDRLAGAERYMSPDERTPEQQARVEAMRAEVQALIEQTNEAERAREKRKPKETPAEAIARVRAMGPVILGHEMANKLRAMGARFEEATE